MNDQEIKYYNIDIGRVSVTAQEQDLARVQALLGNLVVGKRLYMDWINRENPSPSLLGFYVVLDDQAMFANFHDLPFYYHNFHTRVSYWNEYHQIIISHVTKNSAFKSWRGQGSLFDPALLPLLVRLLNKIAVDPFFSQLHHQIVSKRRDIAG